MKRLCSSERLLTKTTASDLDDKKVYKEAGVELNLYKAVWHDGRIIVIGDHMARYCSPITRNNATHSSLVSWSYAI